MPWAEFRTEFAVGPVHFWPFAYRATERIQDLSVLGYLRRFFKCFVDCTSIPVDSITVCSLGDMNFRQYTDAEFEQIRRAVDAVVFAAIAPANKTAVRSDNTSLGPPSADRFVLYTRNFDPADNTISVRQGHSLHSYDNMEEVHFTRPFGLGGYFWSTDNELLCGFGRLLQDDTLRDLTERLFRSLEWFRLAHTESDSLTWMTKVAMMATAFEILLAFPPNAQKKKEYFAKYINRECRDDDSVTETRNDQNGRPHEGTKAAWWAWDFYDLRSHILHGDVVPPDSLRYVRWVTQLIVADLVMWEVVVRQLFSHRCVGDRVRECAKKWVADLGGDVEDFQKLMLAGMLGFGFDDYHRALGWLPPLRCRDYEEQPGNGVA